MVGRVMSLCLLVCAGAGWLAAPVVDAAMPARQDRAAGFEALLATGELPSAIGMARQEADAARRDAMLASIARRQGELGAPGAALRTAAVLSSRSMRDRLLDDIGSGGGAGPVSPAGAGGGITLQDFNPLINLIQRTIASDSWTGTGNGDGTILPFLAGVWVDPDAVMHRIQRVENREHRAGAMRAGSSEAAQETVERSVSLVALEREARRCLQTGERIAEPFRLLGGLYEITGIAAIPDAGDLVLIGRAGPWTHDADGRAVNAATGRPVLQLDDLVSVLRAVQRGDGRFGCTITPRKENLAAMQQFLATSRLGGEAWVRGLRNAVGLQDVDVFGIDPQSRAARILVDADHHMKLVGMGIEPAVQGVESYFGQQVAGFHGQPVAMDVARWWFTLGEFSLDASDDDCAFALRGRVVKVLSETEMIDRQGERIHTGTSVGPTAKFAGDFTDHFEPIAERYPVYQELRNVFAMAVVCSVATQYELPERIGWDWGCLAELSAASTSGAARPVAWQPARSPAPRLVESVMNYEQIRTRTASSTLTHTIAGVSGGVGCFAREQVAQTRADRGTRTFSGLWTSGVNRPDEWQYGRPGLWSDAR